MEFIEVRFSIDPIEPARDILIAQLSEIGYDSFQEDDDGLKAYVSSELFSETSLRELHVLKDRHFNIDLEFSDLPDVNWNAEWEKNYDPIEIGGKVRVYAPFHEEKKGFEHQILIDPRMSFGTGHHATTRLMLNYAFGLKLTDKRILDMGCGTAVIAILAKMRGASSVLAIDIDENAVRNSKENIKLNHVEIDVQKGTSESLKGRIFDVIFANINRNVLLGDMSIYSESLEASGVLIISGFYEQDEVALMDMANSCGLDFKSRAQELEWCAMEFEKR